MHHTQDDYYFTWPSDATELVVRSEWLYRKLDHAFLQWAYDATDATIPILVASRMEAVIPLR
jgi:hypothetical protein